MPKLSKWDYRFIDLAKLVASWSKDPSRKVGAVISRGNRTLSYGFNGFPSGVEDLPSRLEDKDTKRELTVHAELNAILNAKQDLAGCTLYVYPLVTCVSCAIAARQAGVSRVVVYIERPQSKTWEDSGEKAKAVFAECGIEYIEERAYLADNDLFSEE